MNKKLKIGLLVLTIAALFVAPDASALPGYVTPLTILYGTGLSCGECHVSSGGGGSLTAYGTSFAGQSKHMSDPTSALTAIGAPPGAAPAPTSTSTQAPTPDVTTPAPVSTVTTPATTSVVTTPATTSIVTPPVQTTIVATVTSKNITEEDHHQEKVCEKDHHDSEVSEHDHDERVSEQDSHDEKASEEDEKDED